MSSHLTEEDFLLARRISNVSTIPLPSRLPGRLLIGKAHDRCHSTCAVCCCTTGEVELDAVIVGARDVLLDNTYVSTEMFAHAMSRYMLQREVWCAREQMRVLRLCFAEQMATIGGKFQLVFGNNRNVEDLLRSAAYSKQMANGGWGGGTARGCRYASTGFSIEGFYCSTVYHCEPPRLEEWFRARAGRIFLFSVASQRIYHPHALRAHTDFWNVFFIQ